MFEAAIHSDNEIKDVVKFIFLKSYLTGPAADAVAGKTDELDLKGSVKFV